MTLILTVLVVALVFEYINGFHDTANAIATTVSTKVLTPRQAIVLAAVFNLLGALAGTAVATTIGKGLVDTHFVTATTLLGALLAAIAWNLLTWWLGLPSSSSHALIGGLCGATLASAGSNWSVIQWSVVNPATAQAGGAVAQGGRSHGSLAGVWHRHRLRVHGAADGAAPQLESTHDQGGVRAVQLLSASWMGFSHGTNDAQKTMGIIALTLFTATTKTNAFEHLPSWLEFLRTPEFEVSPGSRWSAR